MQLMKMPALVADMRSELPNATIQIVKYKTRWYPQVNIGMCLFCGLCVDVCP